MSGPRIHRGFVTPNMTGTPATRSQEEKDLQNQRLKFQETQVEASEKALTRASIAYNESSTSANADIVNTRKIRTAEKDAENVYRKAGCMEDDLSKLQALTPVERWDNEAMDALFLTVREKNTKVQEHIQALWTSHLEAVKEHDSCDVHGNPASKHRVELSLKPMQIQSVEKHGKRH